MGQRNPAPVENDGAIIPLLLGFQPSSIGGAGFLNHPQ